MNNSFVVPSYIKIQHIEDGRFIVFYSDGSQLSYKIEDTKHIKWIKPEGFSLEQIRLISEHPINEDDMEVIKYASYRLIADMPLIDDDGSNPEPDSIYCKKSTEDFDNLLFQIPKEHTIPCWLLTAHGVGILDFNELTEV